jgi:uncharacterized protein (DUF427 family)
MSLTMGAGPFGGRAAGTFNFEAETPAHVLYLEPTPRRYRGIAGRQTVLDTVRSRLLLETGIPPVLYVPDADVREDLLEASDHATHCPFKGDASHWNLRVGERVVENAAWSYPEPVPGAPPLAGLLAFRWHALDRWLEEDDEIFGHVADPYHRVDVRPSSRRVTVTAGGRRLAETDRPLVLFETGLPPRYYLPRGDVRTDLLHRSDTVTRCPYKGQAAHWSLENGAAAVDDIAWSYPSPLPAAAALAGWLCFSPKLAAVRVQEPAGLGRRRRSLARAMTATARG